MKDGAPKVKPHHMIAVDVITTRTRRFQFDLFE